MFSRKAGKLHEMVFESGCVDFMIKKLQQHAAPGRSSVQWWIDRSHLIDQELVRMTSLMIGSGTFMYTLPTFTPDQAGMWEAVVDVSANNLKMNLAAKYFSRGSFPCGLIYFSISNLKSP